MSTKKAMFIAIGSLVAGAVLFWLVSTVMMWHAKAVYLDGLFAKQQAYQQQSQQPHNVPLSTTPLKTK